MLREVRLGLALNGGVSLAIWIGGVVDEFLRAVSAGQEHPEAQPEWVALCHELDVVVEIDVVVGTSAGGLNGAFLATGLANSPPNLVALQNLWIEVGDFAQLLQPPRTAGIRSLLRGDTFFLPNLQRARVGRGERARRTRARPAAGHPAHLHRPQGQGAAHLGRGVRAAHRRPLRRVPLHRRGLPLQQERPGVSPGGAGVPSTASFPGAFEASPIPAGLFEARHAPALAVDGTVVPTYLVDGGVLNNLPARNAVEAIASQPAGERVYRALALVVPDPGGQAQGPEEPEEPLLGHTMGRSAMGIPRNQSLSQFISEVRNLNNDVNSRRAARAAFLGELGELDALRGICALHRCCRGAVPVLPRCPPPALDRPDAQPPRRPAHPELADVLVRVAGDADSVMLPWVPDAYDVRAGDAWGGSPLRRLAALLLTWTDLAAIVLTESGDAGRRVAAAQHEAKHQPPARRGSPPTHRSAAIDDLLLEELRRSSRGSRSRPSSSRCSAGPTPDDIDQLQGLVGRLRRAPSATSSRRRARTCPTLRPRQPARWPGSSRSTTAPALTASDGCCSASRSSRWRSGPLTRRRTRRSGSLTSRRTSW